MARPNVRTTGTTTIMSAPQGYRVYNIWGYGGIASVTEYLAIDGSDWVHCMDGLLDTDDRIQPRQ
jgi:hypothetical protein